MINNLPFDIWNETRQKSFHRIESDKQIIIKFIPKPGQRLLTPYQIGALLMYSNAMNEFINKPLYTHLEPSDEMFINEYLSKCYNEYDRTENKSAKTQKSYMHIIEHIYGLPDQVMYRPHEWCNSILDMFKVSCSKRKPFEKINTVQINNGLDAIRSQLDQIAYRFISIKEFSVYRGSYHLKTIILKNQYMSTSLSPFVVYRSYMTEIIIPEGIYLIPFVYSAMEEYEILIPPWYEFELVKTVDENTFIYKLKSK